MRRIEANCKILNLLQTVVEQHPDWRFHQILQNLRINLLDQNDGVVSESKCIDQFHEESEETFKRIELYSGLILDF